MGYTTNFYGSFQLDKPLTDAHSLYLKKFAETRRMKRDPDLLPPDPVREAVGLPPGPDGAYFVGGLGSFGQGRDPSILDCNNPPHCQPGLWNHWVPTPEDDGIEWDGGEKFYSYVDWLEYIIEHFLTPWGYVLNGTVTWSGEDQGDVGYIEVKDNFVTAREGDPVRNQMKDILTELVSKHDKGILADNDYVWEAARDFLKTL